MLVYCAMDRNPSPPDYELADRIALTEPSQVKALSHPLRTAILGLLHERAATVNELAVALGRPKSTVAHHVNVLTTADCCRSCGRAGYGRSRSASTAGPPGCSTSGSTRPGGDEMPRDFNDFEVAAQESAAAYRDGKLWGFIRHARITETQASEFWDRMAGLVEEFDRLPRSGDTMYGFAIGVYPTDHPTLPSSDV